MSRGNNKIYDGVDIVASVLLLVKSFLSEPQRGEQTPLMKIERVEWEEQRSIVEGGLKVFCIIAEREEGRGLMWTFYERTSWDIAWILVPSTLPRIKVADAEIARKQSVTEQPQTP